MSIQVLPDEEELIGEEERPRWEVPPCSPTPRFPKVPTLPAAVLQIVLCAGQIGEGQ